MQKEYSAKVVSIVPDAKESEESIATAYMKININGREYWCFVPNWREYFPYYPTPSKLGVGDELIRNLIGKKTAVNFKLVDYKIENTVKSRVHRKEVMQGKLFGSAECTKIIGRIVDEGDLRIVSEDEKKEIRRLVESGIMKDVPRPSAYKTIYIDCGIIVKMTCDADKFKVGDWIQSEGRLDTYITHIDGKKM